MGKKVYWSVPAENVYASKDVDTGIVYLSASSEVDAGDITPEDVPKTSIGAKVQNYKFVLDYQGVFTNPENDKNTVHVWSNKEFKSFEEAFMFTSGEKIIDGAVAFVIGAKVRDYDPPVTQYTDMLTAMGKNYSDEYSGDDPAGDIEIYELDDFEKLAKNYSDAEAVTPKAPIVEALKRYYTVVEHIPAEAFKDCDTIADVIDAASKQ